MKSYDCNLDSISFSFYTPEEVRKLSTKEITSLISIEPRLGSGAVNGLYDSSLGSLSDREPCRNCNLSYYDCNGHFGRIEFSKTIYNPLLFDILAKFIKGVCFYCHRLNYTQGLLESICDLNQINTSLNIKKFNDFENMKSKSYTDKQKNAIKIMSSQTRKNCHHCHNKSLVFQKSRKCEIIVHISLKETRDKGEPDCKRMKLDETPKLRDFKSSFSHEELYGSFTITDKSIFPEILREHLRLLWANESENIQLILPMLRLNNNFQYPTDVFFMENMLINPPMNRLPAVMNGDQMSESPETTNMVNVVRSQAALQEIIKLKDSKSSEQHYQNLREGILELQKRVNVCYDSNRHKELTGSQPGLRQKIDKKEGLFRSNIMGKRVNFSCRSVISPDPTIGLDEIGVPIVFLSKLTFPEPLNHHNCEFLYQCVRNGPDVYPGAVTYQIDNRAPMFIGKNIEEIVANLDYHLQNNHRVIVSRHALSGDALIMNRQPTLHRPSMQAHIIKAIHDPKAKTLRMHYANCKAYNADFDGDEMNAHYPQSILAQSEAKLLVNVCYQHSTPKDGSPLAGLIQDHIIAGTKLSLRDALFTRNEFIDLVHHGLLNSSPRPLALPLPAIMYPQRLWTGKQILSTVLVCSIPADFELPNISCSEPKKNTMWRISEEELKLKLSDVELIIVNGYICTGIFDKAHLGPSQKGLLSDMRELYGPKIALQILTNLSRLLTRYLIYSGFSVSIKDGFLNDNGESVRKNILNKIRSIGLTSVAKTFNIPVKNIKLSKMVSLMETAQFNKSDEFRNKMTEIDTNFKSLSLNLVNQLGDSCKENLRLKFPHNNLSLMSQTGAKGGESNVTKIAIGLGAIEIEGKRCPLTIAGRTLPSFRRYDFDPVSRGFCVSRFMSGLSPQEVFFESMAGRDGLVDTAVKTSSSGYLQRCLIKHLEDIRVCHDGTVRDNMDNLIQFRYGYDGLDVINSISISKPEHMQVIAKNIKLMERRFLKKQSALKPVLSKVLEKRVDELIVKSRKDFVQMSPKDENKLREIIAVKSMISICQPGEAVGLLAAQSIGEPSTQMTLNTFHNAGQSEMNVTLGIPRLREILMLGSDKIKTPSMEVPVLSSEVASENANLVQKKFTKLFLKDVMQLPFEISIDDYYEIKFTFKRKQDYQNKTDLKRKELIALFENSFIQRFAETLKKTFKQTSIDITDYKDDDNEAVQKEPLNEEFVNNAETEEKAPEKDPDLDDMSDISDIDDLESNKQVDDDEEEEEEEVEDILGEDEKAAFIDEEQKGILAKTKANIKAMLPGVIHDYVIDSKAEPDWIKLYLNLERRQIDIKNVLLTIFENCVISSVTGVDKALIITNNDKSKRFATEGYNISELLKYDSVFDLSKFYTNNIIKMSKLYGIEVAVRCIEKEVKAVFKSYSIDVDNRHLRLIADFLTFSGQVAAFNRHKMNNHPSPIQRASFETALTVINEMLIFGNVDHVKSPSANILLGQVVSNIGTNAMDLLL